MLLQSSKKPAHGVSYKFSTEPLSMYGPYHGNDALSLYNFARTQWLNSDDRSL